MEKALHSNRISVEQGLSHVSVRCFHQDRQGFMWIGTDDGLNRFDGHEFLVFRPESDSGRPRWRNFSVRAIHEDADGDLWVGGIQGFVRFSPATRSFKEHYGLAPDGLQSTSVTAIAGGADGVLWIGTDWGGLHRFDPATGAITHFPLRKPTPANTNQGVVFAIHRSRSEPETLWLGTAWLGLIRFDIATGEIRNSRDAPAGHHKANPPSRVLSIAESNDGMLWISGAGDGLFRFDPVSGAFLEGYPCEGERTTVSDVLVDGSGTVWVAKSGKGLAIFDPENGRFRIYQHATSQIESLSSNQARVLHEDRSGVLWVGTDQTGVCTVDPGSDWIRRHQFVVPSVNEIAPMAVTCVLADPADASIVWFGSFEGLFRWDRGAGEVRSITEFRNEHGEPEKLQVRSLAVRGAGGLWIGSSNGLCRFDPATGLVVRSGSVDAPILAGKRVFSVLEDRNGIVWLGMNPGMLRYDPETGTTRRIRRDPDDPNSIQAGWVKGIIEDRSGELWCIVHSNGIARFGSEGDSFEKALHDPEFPGTGRGWQVYTIVESASGEEILIGSNRGLLRATLAGKSLEVVEVATATTVEKVTGILEDASGALWLNSRQGLVEAVDAGGATPSNIRITDRTLGAAFLDFNTTHARLRSGELLYGTRHGILEVHPERRVLRDPPPVLITDLQMQYLSVGPGNDGTTRTSRDVSRLKTLEVPHRENKVIKFAFAAMDFAAPEQNRYAYRLEGLEDEWHHAERVNSATYTTLKPGNYVFRVKAANSQGVWNEEGASLSLKILPPWWGTWWFRGGVVVSLLLSGVSLGRVQLRAARKRAAVFEEELNKRGALNRELRLSEERFQNLLSHSTEQVWCIELHPPIPVHLPEGEQVELIIERACFAEANDSAAEAYGTTREDLIGSKLETVMPRSLPTSVTLLLEVVRSGYQMTDFETLEVTRDGSEHIMKNNFQGTIENGKLLRVWGTARDVTEQKLAEEMREKHREEMAHASRVATMGGLTAAIAHELNQPLAAIGANAQAARRFMSEPTRDLEEVDAILDDIVADNQRASDVIRRMRNLLKKQAGEEEELNLNKLVKEVGTLIHSDAIIRKIDMQIQLDESIPPVRAGRIEIQQVLLNLILNGFDSMMDGDPDGRVLIIRTEADGADQVRISVIDRGQGLEDVERVFEPFHTTKRDGLGMGLAINATIIQSYGGKIWAENNDGGGSSFRFSLPVQRKQVE